MYMEDLNQATQGSISIAELEQLIAQILPFALIVLFVTLIINIVASWKLFTKAGEQGWKCLIPIYNTIVLYKIIGLSPWLILLSFISIIPNTIVSIISVIISLVISILVAGHTSKSFGKSAGFAVGLFFFPNIFRLILGFGSAEYVGPTKN